MATSYAQKGTIVRAAQVIAFGTTTLAFRILERVLPTVGARWAEDLWFAVPANNGRGDVEPSVPGEEFVVHAYGRRMAAQAWGEGPIVYLLHGWGGRRRQLGAFVDPLVASGYRVVAFDATSHGDSESGERGRRRSTVPEFAHVLAAVRTAAGPAHAVVAHSVGCVAAAIALRDHLSVGRLVFIGSPADVRPHIHKFASRMGLGERILSRLVDRIERRLESPLSHFDMPAIAAQVTTPPLLLVHDRDDNETSWSDSEAIAKAWPAARLLTTTDLGHRRILRDRDVINQVVTFIDTAAPPPPEIDHRADTDRMRARRTVPAQCQSDSPRTAALSARTSAAAANRSSGITAVASISTSHSGRASAAITSPVET
jgi:pimeloyl-ACP methyl ester carboxylesterase